MVEVREARREDRRAVRDVHVASVRGLGGEAYDEQVVDAWAGDEERDPDNYRVEGDDVAFLVAVEDSAGGDGHENDNGTGDEVVGFGELRVGEPEEYEVSADAEIRAMYVAPDHASEGVGTALFRELESRARERDVESVVLTASLNAVPFYERHGFERLREKRHEFGGEVTGRVVEMRKRP
ncbi:MAG: GNAT family N-acetyltransferase [Halolamina sp.]|uniref:GNAT family N-acetyltransferase n=1 Tax=Halolamina sp. TaxID=1940283 RepID=UPI002FC2CD18